MSAGKNKIKISCVIITFNEEDNIADCLESVKWCDEIILVDSGSSDNTINIAESFGAKIHKKEFNGFGEQKRFAVSLAENDWIFNIDADEVVSNELQNNILRRYASRTNMPAGFYIHRQLCFIGKKFKYGRESRELLLRLFNKKFGNYNTAKVHENIELKGTTGKMEGILLHNSYKTIEQYFKKFNDYTTRAAIELYSLKKKRSIVLTFLLFPLYFLKNYFLRRNFLNGQEGLIWAFFSSCYPVVKYLKLWMLYNRQKTINTNNSFTSP